MKHVYDMSFAEFQTRLFAWSRMQDREWEKIRLLAWHIESSSMRRKKKMPSLEQFMPLNTDANLESALTEAQKERFLAETYKYLQDLKSIQNG